MPFPVVVVCPQPSHAGGGWGVLGSLELCGDSSSVPKLVAAPCVVKSAADGFLLHPRCQWNVNASPHNTEDMEAVSLICAVQAE